LFLCTAGRSGLEYHEFIFFADREGLDGRIFLSFELYLIGSRADAVGIKNAATGLDVKFPAMPWATDDFSLSLEKVFAHGGGRRVSTDPSLTEGSKLMGADIEDGEVLSCDVKNADRLASDLDDFPGARR